MMIETTEGREKSIQDVQEIPGETMLCRCNEVTYHTVRQQLSAFPELSYQQIKTHCGVASCCGTCEPEFLWCCQEARGVAGRPKKWKRRLNQLIRNFHLFSSLAAAMFLLFFALSGYAMNHRADLGLDDVEVANWEEKLPQKLLSPDSKAELLTWLQTKGARGDLLEYEQDEDTIYVSYKSAGQSFEAEIDRASRQTEISIQKAGFLETLGEIHRSPSPDDVRSSWFIDIMAVLMAVVSLSGILLFFRMATRKNKWALLYFAGCIAIAVSLYVKMV